MEQHIKEEHGKTPGGDGHGHGGHEKEPIERKSITKSGSSY